MYIYTYIHTYIHIYDYVNTTYHMRVPIAPVSIKSLHVFFVRTLKLKKALLMFLTFSI